MDYSIMSQINGLFGALNLFYTVTNNGVGPLVVEGVIIAPGTSQQLFISQNELLALENLGTQVTLLAGSAAAPVVSG